MKILAKFIQVFFGIYIIPLTMFADVQVGYGNTASDRIPINANYGYSYTQVIYYQSEIYAAGDITTLSWYFNGTSLSNSNDWTIYLGHTSKTSFASGTDWVPVASMTQVWSGIFTSPFAPGWLTIDISDFTYNNVDNLVVAVDENQPGWNGFNDKFLCTSVSSNRAIYYFNDGTNPNPATPPNGQLNGNISNIILGGLAMTDPPSCTSLFSPADAGTMILTTATLNWSYGGAVPISGYKIYFGTDNPPTNISNGVNVGLATSYNPTPDMLGNSTYYWQVVPFNSAGDATGCPVWSFTTGGLGLQIGGGILTTLPLPIGLTNSYSYSQVIYLQSEINSIGTISALSWYFNGNDLYGSKDWTVYIGHTSKSSFAGGVNDWIPVSSMTQVFSGTIPDRISPGWLTVDIADFDYNNLDNLVVAVDENNSNSSTPGSFYCTNTNNNRAIYYSGSSNPNPASPPSGAPTNYMANIILEGLTSAAGPGSASYISPANGANNILISTLLKWISGQGTPPTGYKIYFGTDNPPSNIANGIDLGNVTSYDPTPDLSNYLNYYWKIIPYNSNGEATDCPVWSFRTKMAGKQVGTGLVISQPLPINAQNNYSYSQVIYLKSEINIAGTIDEIWWYFNGTSLAYSNDWTIYVGHTSKASFTSNTDWLPISAMTQVWNGTFTSPTAPGWLSFNISDFAYNNTDNLVIAVDENKNYTDGSDAMFQCTSMGTYRAIYSSGNSNINPSAPPTGTRLGYIANVYLAGLGSVSPPAPATLVSPANGATNLFNTISLNWISGGGIPTGYKIYLGTDNPPTNVVNGSNLGNVTTVDPTPDLDYLTTYYWKIVPYNAYGDATLCAVWTFTTGPDQRITVFPHTESFTGAGFPPYGWLQQQTGGPPSLYGEWQRMTSGIASEFPHSAPAMAGYYFGQTVSSGIIITPPIIFPSNNYQVNFWMYRHLDYYFGTIADKVNVYYNTNPVLSGAVLLGTVNRVMSLPPVVQSAGWYEYTFNLPAGAGGSYRYIIFEAAYLGGGPLLVDDITFQLIPVCQIPAEQTVANITTTSADLGWTEIGSATIWDIELVDAGAIPSGIPTAENVISNPFSYTGLLPGKSYEWYVRSDCGSNVSEWSGPYGFTTIFSIPFMEDFSYYDWIGWTGIDGTSHITSSPWRWGWLGISQISSCMNLEFSKNFQVDGWIFTPMIDIGTSICRFEFDLALTDVSDTLPASAVGSDDKFEVVISTDSGATYLPLKTWSNKTEPKFGEIPATGQHLVFDLSPYSGLIKFGFHGQSPILNASCRLNVDNVEVYDPAKLPASTTFVSPVNLDKDLLKDGVLSWRAAGGAEGYKFYFGTDNPPTNIENGIDLGNVLSYNFSNLDYNTTYYWKIEPYNVNGTAVNCPVWSFSTFMPLTLIPQCENFDGSALPSMPNGWTQNIDATYGVGVSAQYFNSSPFSVLVAQYRPNENVLLISPPFDPSINLGTKQIRFTGWSPFVYGILSVGSLSDPADADSYQPFDTITLNTSGFFEHIVYLNELAGNDCYFAFKNITNFLYESQIYLDDICIEEIPSCPPPSNLTVSNITSGSALLGWRENGTATSWNIEYGDVGFIRGNGTTITGVSNPFLQSNLSDNHDYDYYVQADCGGEQSVWSAGKSFTTNCGIFTVPFIENADSTSPYGFILPDCWSKIIEYSGNSINGIGVESYNAHSLPNSFAMITTDGNSSDVSILISPKISGGMSDKKITFYGMDYHYASNSNSLLNSIIVGSMSDPTDKNTFHPFYTFPLYGNYSRNTLYFDSSAGSDEYLAFKQGSQGINIQNEIMLDDITIDNKPTCPPPTFLTAAGHSSSSEMLGWVENGTSNLWNIEYGDTGFTPGTGEFVNSDTMPFTLNGLASSHSYDFYVQADCGSEQSTWSDFLTFTTLCESTTIPWSENFDEVTFPTRPSCIVTESLNDSNSWQLGGTISNSFPNSFILKGLHDYEHNPLDNEAWFFSAPLNLTGGVIYSVSFYFAFATTTWTDKAEIELKWGKSPVSSAMLNGPIFYIDNSNSSGWSKGTGYFIPENSGIYYLGWHGMSKGARIHIDNLLADTGPDCPPPGLLPETLIAPSTVILNWAVTGSETSWNIEYGVTGFVTGTGTVITNVGNAYELTGLTAPQTYDYYVQANCGDNQSEWSGPGSFFKGCEAFELPFNDHFDFPEIPDCWTRSYSGCAGFSSWGYSSPDPVYMDEVFPPYYMSGIMYPNCFATVRLISPPLNLEGKTPVLEFSHYYQFYDQSVATFKIQSSSDGINWTDEAAYTPGNSNVGIETVRIPITHNLGPHTLIAWAIEGEDKFVNWSFDDVYLDDFSTHPRPTSLDVCDLTNESATLLWNSFSGSSEIEWMEKDMPAKTGNLVADVTSPFDLTGLTANTAYKFYVRDIWGANDYSPREGPFYFYTREACIAGSVDEGESCGTDVNGGCNMLPGTEAFTPVANGVTICGNTHDDGTFRDTDWFILELENGYNHVKVDISAETDVFFGTVDQVIPGVAGCDNTAGTVTLLGFPAGEPGIFEVFYEKPGTYYFWMAQSDWKNNNCPGSNYTAKWTVENLGPPACNITPANFSVDVYTNGNSQEFLNVHNPGGYRLDYTAEIEPDTVYCYPHAAEYWTGSCTSSQKTQSSYISGFGQEIGWAKFDISNIPADATITGISFRGHITDYSGPVWKIRRLFGVDPVTAPPEVIFDSIFTNPYFHSYSINEDTMLPSGYVTRLLEYRAVYDLQEALSSGWFAIGFLNESAPYNYAQFEGWNETHPPRLEVTYFNPSTAWLSVAGGTRVTENVSAGNSDKIPINFDAAKVPDGIYNANIIVRTNVPDQFTVPVTMNVGKCIECPAGAISENEPAGTNINGGCNMVAGTEAFTPIENGTTICGNTWCNGSQRDTDWFELTLTTSWNRITVEAWAGTDLDIGLVSQTLWGIPGCNNITGYIYSNVEVPACGTNTLAVDLENPGTYYFWVGQSQWNESYPGTPYFATWNVETSDPPVAKINPLTFTKNLIENEIVQDNLKIENTGDFPLYYHALVFFNDSNAATVLCYPKQENFWTGSCDPDKKWPESTIHSLAVVNGWAKFDISNIPAGAIITDVKFHGYVDTNTLPNWVLTTLGILDPVIASASILNTYIYSHSYGQSSYSYNPESVTLPDGWLMRTLNDKAVADLQNAVSKGWFAVGIADIQMNWGRGIIFQGWADANPPYLEVRYAMNPVGWLSIDNVTSFYDSVNSANTDNITVGFDATGVPPGSYGSYITIATNESGTPLYFIPVTMNVGFQQILNIPGGWSGVSGYLDPFTKGVEGIFAPYSADFIILSSMTQFYYPEAAVNTIGNWNYETGYKIKAANEFAITLTGLKPGSQTLELAQGWNLIPVLSSQNVDVVAMFSSVNLVIAKEVAGNKLYWPQFGINTLGYLAPGKAYFVMLASPGVVDYSGFKNVSVKNLSVFENQTGLDCPWPQPKFTPSSHAIAFPVEVLVNSGIRTGDFIGVFTPEGLSAGFTEITGLTSNTALVSFSNDETTAKKDGFEIGEMLHFKLYRPQSREEIEMEVTFDPTLPNMGIFENQGLSAVKSITLNPAEIPENTGITSEVYPNPSHGIFFLSMSSWPENIQIRVMDLKGRAIRGFEPGKKLNGSTFAINLTDLQKGIYFLKLTGDGLFEMKKIVID